MIFFFKFICNTLISRFFFLQVIKEDVEKVKKYVKRGQEDGNQQVPQKRFKSLLNKEENLVNVRDRYSRTPLHLCATNGNIFFFHI